MRITILDSTDIIGRTKYTLKKGEGFLNLE